MDEQPHQPPEHRDTAAPAHDAARIDREQDLLDEPVLPLLGLSAGTLAAIFVGGALGTVARYLLESHHPVAAGGFPWVTLLVNLTGSFAIGLLIPLTEHVAPRAPLVRPLAIIGFLGGWTTYSTLAVDATLLAKHGDVVTCLAYLAATVAGGLALVVAGHSVGRRMTES
ncbi:MAG: CrcB family protein [Acidimicrobiales bacterium]|jgi:CrcB protein